MSLMSLPNELILLILSRISAHEEPIRCSEDGECKDGEDEVREDEDEVDEDGEDEDYGDEDGDEEAGDDEDGDEEGDDHEDGDGGDSDEEDDDDEDSEDADSEDKENAASERRKKVIVTLRSLVLLNRRMSLLVPEELYREVQFDYDDFRLRMFVKTVIKSPQLALLVRSLSLSFESPCISSCAVAAEQHIKMLLTALTALKRLRIVSESFCLWPRLLQGSRLRSLRHVSIRFTDVTLLGLKGCFMQPEIMSVKVYSFFECPLRFRSSLYLWRSSPVERLHVSSELSLGRYNRLTELLCWPRALQSFTYRVPSTTNGLVNNLGQMRFSPQHVGQALFPVRKTLVELKLQVERGWMTYPVRSNSVADLSSFITLRVLEISSLFLFGNPDRDRTWTRPGFSHRLPKSLNELKIVFQVQSSASRKAIREYQFDDPNAQDDFEWLLELAERKLSRFPGLVHVCIIEDTYEKDPVPDGEFVNRDAAEDWVPLKAVRESFRMACITLEIKLKKLWISQ